jgi:hypothetical protein
MTADKRQMGFDLGEAATPAPAPPRKRSSLLPRDWDWKPDVAVCDVVIENRCVNGEVSYRAKTNDGRPLLNGRDDFGYQDINVALKVEGHVPR